MTRVGLPFWSFSSFCLYLSTLVTLVRLLGQLAFVVVTPVRLLLQFVRLLIISALILRIPPMVQVIKVKVTSTITITVLLGVVTSFRRFGVIIIR